ncbi:MAG: hypothetical protein ACQEQN_02280, partial [Thermodesulfobacteriota bacterium]
VYYNIVSRKANRTCRFFTFKKQTIWIISFQITAISEKQQQVSGAADLHNLKTRRTDVSVCTNCP